MKPQDKSNYEQIYQENRDMRGEISCRSRGRLDFELVISFLSLHFPPQFIRSKAYTSR